MKDFFDLIARRESCRNYDPNKKVETEKLVKCIEAARLAPSACNSQPWSFVVVNSPSVSPQVAKCVQGMGMNRFTDNCPAFLIVVEEKATLTAKICLTWCVCIWYNNLTNLELRRTLAFEPRLRFRFSAR